MCPRSRDRVYQFGDYRFEANSLELRRDAEAIPLQHKPALALRLLLENAGDVVSREELREELWDDDVHIEFDQSLNACMRRLRAALDDDPDDPMYVQTLPRRGYRLVASVQAQGHERYGATGSDLETTPWSSQESTAPRGLVLAGLVGVAVTLLLAALVRPAPMAPRVTLQPFETGPGISPKLREVVHDELALALIRRLDGEMVLVFHEMGSPPVEDRGAAAYVVEGRVAWQAEGVRLALDAGPAGAGEPIWSRVYRGGTASEDWAAAAEDAARRIVDAIEDDAVRR